MQDRTKSIGGSDSPVIVLDNDHPFKNRATLYREKTGESPGQEMNKYMERGLMMESIIAQKYSQETGRETVSCKEAHGDEPLIHPDYPFISGNTDYDILGDPRGLGELEIKCVGLQTFAKIKRDGLPQYVIIQNQHYLGFPIYSWGSVGIFNCERWELIHFDLEPDREMIDMIYGECQLFWDHVQNRVPPEGYTPKISVTTDEGEGKIVRGDSPKWLQAISALREAKELKAQSEQIEEEAKEACKELFGGADTVEGRWGKIHYKMQAGRKSFDHERCIKDYPDTKVYLKQGEPFRVFKPYLKGEE